MTDLRDRWIRAMLAVGHAYLERRRDGFTSDDVADLFSPAMSALEDAVDAALEGRACDLPALIARAELLLDAAGVLLEKPSEPHSETH